MDKKDLDVLRTEEFIAHDLELLKNSDRWKRYGRLIANAMGAISWVGTILSMGAARSGEKSQEAFNQLYEEWLKVHKEKIGYLIEALDEVAGRLENVPDELGARIESEEYLGLVRRAFRSWDSAETLEKQGYIVNLISNAAATKLCPDDMIRLFNDWLDTYHEVHFKVIREIYQNPGCTRYEIWTSVSGDLPREDSAEADLFKLLIRDLSTGGVIRQNRETTYDGQFVKQSTKGRKRGSGSGTMESAFEDTKPYVLTELGSQFVHYTMNAIVKRLKSEA
ncbi:MAG: hypothetical protein AB2826_24670 [Candidatus Thiodiazotropha sp.]